MSAREGWEITLDHTDVAVRLENDWHGNYAAHTLARLTGVGIAQGPWRATPAAGLRAIGINANPHLEPHNCADEIAQLRAECEALRYSNAMLSRIVQDQLADLGLKGIGDHMSQYLLPDDECDKCGVLRKVDDEMVERAARATMTRVAEESDLFADDEEALRIHREYARIALTAAMAVQPTTGDTP